MQAILIYGLLLSSVSVVVTLGDPVLLLRDFNKTNPNDVIRHSGSKGGLVSGVDQFILHATVNRDGEGQSKYSNDSIFVELEAISTGGRVLHDDCKPDLSQCNSDQMGCYCESVDGNGDHRLVLTFFARLEYQDGTAYVVWRDIQDKTSYLSSPAAKLPSLICAPLKLAIDFGQDAQEVLPLQVYNVTDPRNFSFVRFCADGLKSPIFVSIGTDGTTLNTTTDNCVSLDLIAGGLTCGMSIVMTLAFQESDTAGCGREGSYTISFPEIDVGRETGVASPEDAIPRVTVQSLQNENSVYLGDDVAVTCEVPVMDTLIQSVTLTCSKDETGTDNSGTLRAEATLDNAVSLFIKEIGQSYSRMECRCRIAYVFGCNQESSALQLHNLKEKKAPTPSSDHLVGPVVGGVIAGIVIIGIVVLVVYFIRRRSSKNISQKDDAKEYDALERNVTSSEPSYLALYDRSQDQADSQTGQNYENPDGRSQEYSEVGTARGKDQSKTVEDQSYITMNVRGQDQTISTSDASYANSNPSDQKHNETVEMTPDEYEDMTSNDPSHTTMNAPDQDQTISHGDPNYGNTDAQDQAHSKTNETTPQEYQNVPSPDSNSSNLVAGQEQNASPSDAIYVNANEIAQGSDTPEQDHTYSSPTEYNY